MKAVLGLALLCCFVVGNLGNHCKNSAKECKNFKDCACSNPLAIRARIKNLLDEDYPLPDKHDVLLLYKIRTIHVFKPMGSEKNIDYLVVPKECKWTLPVDNAYIFFCDEIKWTRNGEEGRACKISMPRGFKKLTTKLKVKHEQILRQLRDGTLDC